MIIVKKYEQFHKLYFFLSFLLFEIVPFILLFTFNLNLVRLIKSSTKELESFDNEKKKKKSSNITTKKTNNKTGNDDVEETTSRRYLSVNDRRSIISNDPPSSTQFMETIDDSNKSSSRHKSSTATATTTTTTTTRILNLKNKSIMYSKIEKRKRDQYKLTRTLIFVVFLVLLSEISSISTYDRITEFLVGRRFNDYMNTYYKLQVFISNLIVLVVHSVNFFLYCAFNKKYLTIFKQKYSFLF